MDAKSTARRYYDLVDAGDYDELVSLFATDVVYDRPGQATIRGREDLREFYETDRPLEAGTHEIHSVVQEGDTVAVRGTFEGEQDGEPVSIGFADFHEFDRDRGVIARRYTYTDRDEV
ncbi:MAG: nuclear transport factor 2 family protein [Halobaculum sp.]